MAWDILFFSLGGPVEGYTGAQTVVFAGSICYYAIRNSDTAMGGAGNIIFNSLGGTVEGNMPKL